MQPLPWQENLCGCRLARPALRRPFPPPSQEWEVQAKARFIESCRIRSELPFVSDALFVEELLDAGALVAAGLEVDDPPRASGIAEQPVDHVRPRAALVAHAQAVFGRGFWMRTEQPSPAIVGQRIFQSISHLLCSGLGILALQTATLQIARKSRG